MTTDRLIVPRIRAAMADTPVVVVNGARQVGKSTLVTDLLQLSGRVEVMTLDHEPTLRAASMDPRTFVERSVDTLVIDEAQLEPRLFRAVKAAVDADRRPGRFLLTGSARLLSVPEMADALVGRVEVIELWPFSEVELAGSRSSVLDVIERSPDAIVESRAVRRRRTRGTRRARQLPRGSQPCTWATACMVRRVRLHERDASRQPDRRSRTCR